MKSKDFWKTFSVFNSTLQLFEPACLVYLLLVARPMVELISRDLRAQKFAKSSLIIKFRVFSIAEPFVLIQLINLVHFIL